MIVRYDLRGNIGGADVFQCGFHAETDADLTASATTVAAAIPALVASLWPASIVWKSVRANEINEASGAIVRVAEVVVPTTTASGALPLPAEVALCVTIRPVTGLIAGRFYLPSPSVGGLDANGNLTSAAQGVFADRLQVFFQTALGASSSPIRLGVYSRKNHNYVGAQSIEVGSVFDSQRRRRNKLVEIRLSRGIL